MKRYMMYIVVIAGLAIGAVAGLMLVRPTGEVSGGEAAFSMAAVPGGVTRTYYIAADLVEWDYAPSGINEMTGEDFGEEENVFVEQGPKRIGDTYLKAQYREYTDDTFSTLQEIPEKWTHKGILGPVIQAEVGDTIVVVFKNNTSFPASVHPHGVFYDKDSEGAPYADGTDGTDKADDNVPPGATHTYTWEVPERAGPGPQDPSSILWMYHSHVDEPADTNAGLIGPIIVTRHNLANEDGSPSDVDREFITLFTVFDENSSLYLDDNIETYTGRPRTVMADDDDFVESNLMHVINGYVYGNLPLDSLSMHQGEQVRWYVAAMGTEVDLHTPHWHGNTGLMNGNRVDIIELLPLSMKVVDMVPDDVGTWMYHCHVNDHISAGMMARFRVDP